MKKDNHQAINRRDFLKIVGISTATTAPLLSGCSSDSGMASGSGSSTPIPTDRMTYRTTPSTKDKVSILGYGCMRLPTIAKNSARDSDDEIDQEMVNRLTDYAIEHGVNYFDPPTAKDVRNMLWGSPSAAIHVTNITSPPNFRTSLPTHGAAKPLSRCITIRSRSCKSIISIICCSTGSAWVVWKLMKTGISRTAYSTSCSKNAR